MKRAVRDVAGFILCKSIPFTSSIPDCGFMVCILLLYIGFVASFAAFSDLTNDEHTRTFLSLEIGAGHKEV